MKKLVAVILAAVMVAGLMAGCGGKQNNEAPVDVGSHTTDDDGKVNGVMYKEGLPIVDEGTYGFSIFVDSSSSTGEFYMMNELKKQTNVDVELRLFPYETAKERLNLDLNSGDYADVVGGWVLSDQMVLQYGVEQGIFIPLEDLIAEYAPNIQAILDREGVRETMTTPDGHIYTIPYVCDDSVVGYVPYINSTWLENVNMEMPTTTEEFEAVLKAFKEQDANGNGDANDEIPFSADPNNLIHLGAMTGWFGLPVSDKIGMAMVDGELVYAGCSSEYREFLKYFNNLYAQGLIDPEMFTQDLSTWQGKGNKGLYGVSVAWGSSEFTGEEAKEEKGEYDILPVLNAKDGGTWFRSTLGYSTYKTQAVITNNAKNPEAIIRWFDNAFAHENGIGINYGPVGVVMFEEEDGRYRKIDVEAELSEEEQEAVSWSNLWPQSLPKYLMPNFKDLINEDRKLYDEKEATEAYYEDYIIDDVIPSIWVEIEDADQYSDTLTAITDYYKQEMAFFISGEKDPSDDAQWQNYIDGMYSLGLEEFARMRGITRVME